MHNGGKFKYTLNDHFQFAATCMQQPAKECDKKVCVVKYPNIDLPVLVASPVPSAIVALGQYV